MHRTPPVYSRNNATTENVPLQNLTILDCNSMLDVGEAIAASEQEKRVSVDYSKLFTQLQNYRVQANPSWAHADISIALISANDESEGQQRFASALERAGFKTDVSFYRDNYVSLPAGRKPADFYDQSKDKEKRQRPLVSLAPRIAYALGLLARYDAPQVLVVTHSFELYWPMLNFAQRNVNARVGLAFFASLLDYRWKQAGLFGNAFPITFFNLEENSAELLGGIDLSGRSKSSSILGQPPNSALSRL